ncbi:MAG TPA: aldehyde dehydrogenase family protein, partial [Verrucomicrobiae bacterium]|nr:aldehyde dehydrogenase family protein [Verrucomicrobiae bacterium]
MKTKLKPVKLSAKRIVAATNHAVIPLRERRLNFGDKWNYAPAPEDSKNYVIAPRHELFIGGKFVKPHSQTYFPSINPATEEKLTEISFADATDVDKAVKSARRAYDKVWSKMPGRERGKYLYRIARIIQEKARELAVLETMDGGKTIKESRDVDLPLVAAHFFYYAGWADKLKYAFPGKTPQPLGVAGQIIPWNFPLLMAAWKIAPALACGNTVVLKPAETTSLTAMRLAQIFQEAELPEGVVNIVTGAGETGAALVNHSDVNKIAFTGSTEIGKWIAKAIAERSGARQSAGNFSSNTIGRVLPNAATPRLTLELGGKAANILFEDAPIDQAIEGVINGIYFNQGHVCCAGSRLFVQEGIYSKVIKKLRDRIQTLRVGNPLDKNTDIGAINSRPQLEKIRELVQSGVDEGAELTQTQCTLPAKGYWFAPSFLTGVTHAHRVANEEIFGPVLSVMTFRTPEEAFERANNIPYGLSAGVWTD